MGRLRRFMDRLRSDVSPAVQNAAALALQKPLPAEVEQIERPGDYLPATQALAWTPAIERHNRLIDAMHCVKVMQIYTRTNRDERGDYVPGCRMSWADAETAASWSDGTYVKLTRKDLDQQREVLAAQEAEHDRVMASVRGGGRRSLSVVDAVHAHVFDHYDVLLDDRQCACGAWQNQQAADPVGAALEQLKRYQRPVNLTNSQAVEAVQAHAYSDHVHEWGPYDAQIDGRHCACGAILDEMARRIFGDEKAVY